MRTLAFSSFWTFLIITWSTKSLLSLEVTSAGKCQSDQQSLLLQLQNSLVFGDDPLPWNQSTDCCSWEGVSCQEGHVVGLHLSHSSIIGGLTDNSSLFHFQYLHTLDLSFNNFGTRIPSRFGNLTSLRYLNLAEAGFVGKIPIEMSRLKKLVNLDLSYNDLYGTFPKEIFQVPTLETIDISSNQLLHGSLPEFSPNNSLGYLVLRNTSFSGRLPPSMGNLTKLSTLDLSYCHFNGALPNFKLPRLVELYLSGNKLIGPIPSSLFKVPSLMAIDLSSNQFSGQLPEYQKESSSMLCYLDLSGNNLEGPVPTSLFKLKNLGYLKLSFNKLNGTIQLDILEGIVNLSILDLSHNNLSINANDTSWYSFPETIFLLSLASCKLKTFPNLKNHSELSLLDLSDNQIHGAVPNWIWDLGLYYLNLSHNYLEGIQEPYALPFNISILDLHSNRIHGKIPILPKNLFYIDLSSNNFYSSIPVDTCNMYHLQVLDLSGNNLSGRIPECMSMTYPADLKVLNLGSNNFSGTIPDSFPVHCGLRTLELNGNKMEGQIPKSMANCTLLEVLNLGNNRLRDEFPCFLSNISTLRVLVLRSNKFHGSMGCSKAIDTNWSMLQLIDLAYNNFSNQLPGPNFFTKLKAMISREDNATEKPNCLTAHLVEFPNYEVSTAITNKGQHTLLQPKTPKTNNRVIDFSATFTIEGQDIFTVKILRIDKFIDFSTTVTIKGHDSLLVKILTIDTFIDFSSNNLNGQISEDLGALSLLYSLNLSNNAFSGPIPSSFGKLNSLESLDISRNKLNGSIPTSLASLNFLSHLNLSFNKLVGMIPHGTQFQTFSANSFTGNQGLYGCPLTTICTLPDVSIPPNHDEQHSVPSESKDIDWNLLSVEIGFVVGFGSIIAPLVFCKRWRNLYYETIEGGAFRILPSVVTRKWLSWTSGR